MYHGKFCPDCRRKAATHEFDFNFVMLEVPHSAFHLSKGILFASKELFTRPRKTIKEYFDGKRINHFPPLTYLLIITSVYVFVKSLQMTFNFREIFCYFTASISAIVLTFTLLGVISKIA